MAHCPRCGAAPHPASETCAQARRRRSKEASAKEVPEPGSGTPRRAGRPASIGGDTERLSVRVSAGAAAVLDREAKAAGLSRSAFVRQLLENLE